MATAVEVGPKVRDPRDYVKPEVWEREILLLMRDHPFDEVYANRLFHAAVSYLITAKGVLRRALPGPLPGQARGPRERSRAASWAGRADCGARSSAEGRRRYGGALTWPAVPRRAQP
ncbi:hypothetical protein [Streptomyces sp. NPDC001678]|uniref:hypothetical protein n=1 Tax=Streptomyces sp. NPDC001678 TaxID=3364599 RepID=UPI00367E1851